MKFKLLTKLILSIAPLMPPTPYCILAPSKAGPAAVEQEYIQSLFPKTISPFVPMSISKHVSSELFILLDKIAATVSAPIYAETRAKQLPSRYC